MSFHLGGATAPRYGGSNIFERMLRLVFKAARSSKFHGLQNLRVLHKDFNKQQVVTKENKHTFGRMTSKKSVIRTSPESEVYVLCTLCWWSWSLGSKTGEQKLP